MPLHTIITKTEAAGKTAGHALGNLLSIVRLFYQRKQISGEMERKFTVLGRASYNSFKANTVDESINITCGEIKKLEEESAAITDSIGHLRNRKKCPDCGAVLKRDNIFCPYCGTKQPEEAPDSVIFVINRQKTCPVCGCERAEDAQFCSRCGASFEKQAAE